MKKEKLTLWPDQAHGGISVLRASLSRQRVQLFSQNWRLSKRKEDYTRQPADCCHQGGHFAWRGQSEAREGSGPVGELKTHSAQTAKAERLEEAAQAEHSEEKWNAMQMEGEEDLWTGMGLEEAEDSPPCTGANSDSSEIAQAEEATDPEEDWNEPQEDCKDEAAFWSGMAWTMSTYS